MAGEVALTRLLLGLGLRQFSMHPAQLLAVKQQVLRSSIPEVEVMAQRILRSEDPERTRALLAKLNA
jgi:phosphotransferase system enzyme I (PtsI)